MYIEWYVFEPKNPEISKVIQEAAFSLGWDWRAGDKTVKCTDAVLHFSLVNKVIAQEDKGNTARLLQLQSETRHVVTDINELFEVLCNTVKPIIIHGYPIKFNSDGSLKVGCQPISKEIVDEIIEQRKKAMAQ